MSHLSLHAAVASATGDSLATVERLGFQRKCCAQHDRPDSDDPLAVIDCPFCGGTVVLAWDSGEGLPEFADCRRCETVFSYAAHEIYETDLFDIQVHEPRTMVPAAA
jgi:hypothetical protein